MVHRTRHDVADGAPGSAGDSVGRDVADVAGVLLRVAYAPAGVGPGWTIRVAPLTPAGLCPWVIGVHVVRDTTRVEVACPADTPICWRPVHATRTQATVWHTLRAADRVRC